LSAKRGAQIPNIPADIPDGIAAHQNVALSFLEITTHMFRLNKIKKHLRDIESYQSNQ